MKSNHFKMRWLCLLFALFTLNIQAQITVDIKKSHKNNRTVEQL